MIILIWWTFLSNPGLWSLPRLREFFICLVTHPYLDYLRFQLLHHLFSLLYLTRSQTDRITKSYGYNICSLRGLEDLRLIIQLTINSEKHQRLLSTALRATPSRVQCHVTQHYRVHMWLQYTSGLRSTQSRYKHNGYLEYRTVVFYCICLHSPPPYKGVEHFLSKIKFNQNIFY